jgi:hypothetical protein
MNDCPDLDAEPRPIPPAFDELRAEFGGALESYVDARGNVVVAMIVDGDRFESTISPSDDAPAVAERLRVAARAKREGRPIAVAAPLLAELRAAACAILDNPNAPTTAQRAALRTALRRLEVER